jgi:hypothetical protein
MPQLGAALQGRIVPTNNRYRAGVLQSALQKSRIDRATTRPTAERELELSTGTGLYGGACRSTLQCCLAVSVV